MAEFAEFSAMIDRLRSGDPLIVEQFIATYEPFIRRAVRRSLTQSGLRVAADSADICQSVLASFLIRVAAGEYEFSDQPTMEGLLITIARRRLAMLCRRETGAARDRRRSQTLDSRIELLDQSMEDPQATAETLDLIATFRKRLTESERTLFDQRRQGYDWETIAGRTQENPLVLRKRLSRALKRVSEELGLDHPP